MSVETATTISELDETWPLSGDVTKEGDDHIRLLKSMLIAQFPGALSNGFAIPIISTEVELNYLTGLTSNAQSQLDSLDSRITGLEGVLSAPAGTRLTFNQASVPAVGWTQDITFNDHMMRVVGGLGGGNGGTDDPISYSHAHTTGDHTLIENEMPSHTHTGATRSGQLGSGGASNYLANVSTSTGSKGGDLPHNHGSTGSSSFTPKYIDVIIGVKD